MPSEPADLTGRCMCETVGFEISEPLLGASTATASAASAAPGLLLGERADPPGTFAVTHGSEAVRTYRAGRRRLKSYCCECGSHLFTHHPENRS